MAGVSRLASDLVKIVATKADKLQLEVEIYRAELGKRDSAPVSAVMTRQGPIKVEDLPRDADGDIDQEWLAKNCLCKPHTDRRDTADERSGQYL